MELLLCRQVDEIDRPIPHSGRPVLLIGSSERVRLVGYLWVRPEHRSGKGKGISTKLEGEEFWSLES
jgi:hypothetical protein